MTLYSFEFVYSFLTLKAWRDIECSPEEQIGFSTAACTNWFSSLCRNDTYCHVLSIVNVTRGKTKGSAWGFCDLVVGDETSFNVYVSDVALGWHLGQNLKEKDSTAVFIAKYNFNKNLKIIISILMR